MDAHNITHQLGGTWRNGAGQAPCPICQPERRRDQNALSIGEGNGKVLLHCFKGGCSFVDIANAASLPLDAVRLDYEALQQRDARQSEYAAKGGCCKPVTGCCQW